MYGVASVAGPILGGVVADRLSWSWIFVFIAVAGVPVLVLVARVFPGIRATGGSRAPDYPGMVTLILAVVPLLLALSWGGGRHEWGSPPVVGLLVMGAAMAAVFVVVETKSDSPIMPPAIYADRVVGTAVLMTLLTSFALYGGVLFLPLFFQSVLGVSATASGRLLAPMLLGMVCGGVLAGQLLSRTGSHYRVQALVSTALMTAGMFLLSTMDESTSILRSEIYIVVTGLGVGGALATLSLAVQNSVPFDRVGVATSALQFFRSVGGMLGLAVLGAVLVKGFSVRLDGAALSPEQFAAIKDNPHAATGVPRAGLAEADPGLAGRLPAAVDGALAGALDDVFTVAAAVVALSVAAALVFRVPAGDAGQGSLETGASPPRRR